MMHESPLFTRLAAAYVRGRLGQAPEGCDPALFGLPLDALGEEQLAELVALGAARGLRLHRFKRTMGLPRVAKTLGILRGLAPAELLDVGSGRGAFLWPLLDALPWLPVTALDTLEHRAEEIAAVAAGGVANLRAARGDITHIAGSKPVIGMDQGPKTKDHPSVAAGPWSLVFDPATSADRSSGIGSGPPAPFDVVTMLEVLEHIPDTEAALRAALGLARRFVVLSVPSRPDDNPEHIHLFSATQLERPLLANRLRAGADE